MEEIEKIKVFINIKGDVLSGSKSICKIFVLPLDSLNDVDEVYNYIEAGINAFEDDKIKGDK